MEMSHVTQGKCEASNKALSQVGCCQAPGSAAGIYVGGKEAGGGNGRRRFKSILGQVQLWQCELSVPLPGWEMREFLPWQSMEPTAQHRHSSPSTPVKFGSLGDLLCVVYSLCFPLFHYPCFTFCRDNVPPSQAQKEAADRQAAFCHLQGITVIC